MIKPNGSIEDDDILSIEDFLNANDVQISAFDCTPFGIKGKVLLGTLSAGDMIEWTEANDGESKKTAGLRLLIKSFVDKQGNRIGDAKMLERLKKKSAAMTNAMAEEVLRLNGLNVKQSTVKNDSGEVPAGASPSASPSTVVN